MWHVLYVPREIHQTFFSQKHTLREKRDQASFSLRGTPALNIVDSVCSNFCFSGLQKKDSSDILYSRTKKHYRYSYCSLEKRKASNTHRSQYIHNNTYSYPLEDNLHTRDCYVPSIRSNTPHPHDNQRVSNNLWNSWCSCCNLNFHNVL